MLTLARVPRRNRYPLGRSGHGSLPVQREARRARGTRADFLAAEDSAQAWLDEAASSRIGQRATDAVGTEEFPCWPHKPAYAGATPAAAIAVLETRMAPHGSKRLPPLPVRRHSITSPRRIDMPITRGWQRELDDPNSELSKRTAMQSAIEELVRQGYDRKTAGRIVEQKALAEATRAKGLVPCDCGAPASCWIRSHKLRYSAANCAEHAENTLRAFRDAKLTETEYSVQPMNSEYWLAVTAVELAS